MTVSVSTNTSPPPPPTKKEQQDKVLKELLQLCQLDCDEKGNLLKVLSNITMPAVQVLMDSMSMIVKILRNPTEKIQ